MAWHTNITPVGTLPALQNISPADLVGPLAANRQPNSLKTAADSLQGRVDSLIDNMNSIAASGAGSMFLANAAYLQGREVGGTARNLIGLSSGDAVQVGNASNPLALYGSAISVNAPVDTPIDLIGSNGFRGWGGSVLLARAEDANTARFGPGAGQNIQLVGQNVDVILDAGGVFDMNDRKIIGLADPTAAQDAATRSWVLTQIGGSGYLPTTGGTMTGNIKLATAAAAIIGSTDRQVIGYDNATNRVVIGNATDPLYFLSSVLNGNAIGFYDDGAVSRWGVGYSGATFYVGDVNKPTSVRGSTLAFTGNIESDLYLTGTYGLWGQGTVLLARAEDANTARFGPGAGKDIQLVGRDIQVMLDVGGVMDMNARKITDLADPTAAQDAATRSWVLAQIPSLSGYLPLTGGTMTGSVIFDSLNIGISVRTGAGSKVALRGQASPDRIEVGDATSPLVIRGSALSYESETIWHTGNLALRSSAAQVTRDQYYDARDGQDATYTHDFTCQMFGSYVSFNFGTFQLFNRSVTAGTSGTTETANGIGLIAANTSGTPQRFINVSPVFIYATALNVAYMYVAGNTTYSGGTMTTNNLNSLITLGSSFVDVVRWDYPNSYLLVQAKFDSGVLTIRVQMRTDDINASIGTDLLFHSVKTA